MHVDRGLVEERVTRELYERVLPLVERETLPLAVTAGPSPAEQAPFAPGEMWGPPWGTTWFTFTGEMPERWVGRRVEAVIDLGFRGDAAGFQCEGLIVDEGGRPVQGIHPRRTHYRVESEPGPLTIRLEAASNPSFPQFRPSPLGSPDTAGDTPLYRLRRADLALIDTDVEALVHDLDVVDGLMRTMALDDPRRARFLHTLERALDAFPDVAHARAELQPLLGTRAAARAHHVIATGHAHIDIAWLWPIREASRKCTRTFASAIRLMDEYPEYRFSCSQAQQYAWIETHHPELFEQINVKVHGGQWIPVGGMWVEADMNLPSGESLVRQIVHGQRWFEARFGRRCTEVWIPDVFGYPASMPQVYAAGGMRRFVTQKLSWNTTNRFPHHTFWWEGLDGTRVLTHFPPVDTYNAEVTPAEVAESSRRFREAAWSDWSLMPFGHGDGGGGPTREMLERARRLADVDGSPRVTIGSPAEFFEHVEREVYAGEHGRGAPVPVWRGELYFETHRGTLTSQLRTKVGNRQCERLLREVELWSATLGEPASVDHLWRKVLTQQFHDIIPGSSIAWVHADAERVHAEAIEALEHRRSELLAALVPAGDHVVNPAAVERDEVIETDIGPLRVRVPANGIAPLASLVAEDRVVVTERSMANHHLAVRWDEHGQLVSVIDVMRARELIPAGQLGAVLELAPDHPVRYDAWDLESWTPGLGVPVTPATGTDMEVEVQVDVVEHGPLLGRVRVIRTFGVSSAVVTYALRAGSPRLDIGIELDWQHREHLLSIVFPLDVRADTAACDIQFGHVRRPTHASSPWDAAKFEVCAHRYVDVSEPDFGVAVLNDGRYGHGVFDGRVRVSLARGAQYPDPDADRGRHSLNLALFPHGAGLDDVVAEAERLNAPLRVVRGDGGAALPVPVVQLDGRGVEIDAIKLADDLPESTAATDLIVRLHESVGNRTRVTVRCDRRITAASRCNLLEEPESGLEVGDGICAFTVRPFELVTLRLTRASG